MAPPSSKIWNHFRKKDKSVATCKLCLRDIKFSGNTTNLFKHMKTNHGQVKVGLSESNTKPKNQPSTKFFENQPSTSSSSLLSVVVQGNDDPLPVTSESMSSSQQLSLPSPIADAFTRASAYAIGGLRHAKIVNCILYFICKDNRPFAIIEGEGFKRLIHELSPLFKIPSVKYIKQQLELKYEALQGNVKDKLQRAAHISLSADIWTETMSEKSYLGVTAHFLEGTNVISIDLTCKGLDSNHTGEFISSELKKVLDRWGILSEKVISIVTDNGSNMVLGAQTTFPNKQIPCFAHTLNLVTTAGISTPDMDSVIKKIRKIVIFIKNSVINSDKLRKIQEESGIPEGKVKKMVLDVKTRWNSTFYMVQRFLELLTVVSQILIYDNSSPEMPTSSEIADLRQLESLLTPYEYATTEISGEKYVTISKIIPMVNCLTSHLNSFEASSSSVKAVKKALESEMTKRFGKIEENHRLAVSTILDPRFKNLHFKSPVACASAITKIKSAVKALDKESNPGSEEEGHPKSKPTFDFWKAHKDLAQGKKQKGQSTDSTELSLYLSNAVSPLKSNPLEIWEDLKPVFPSLYTLGRQHLLHMATSVPSERLFSKAGGTVNTERNRLSPKYLDKLIFLASVSDEDWFK